MGDEGLGYGGEIILAQATDGDLARQVEIPFSDERFLIHAANKNPPSALERASQLLGSFFRGVYSWPFDYTLCVHWILGTAGFYGPKVKANCDYHTNRILTVMRAAGTVIYYLIFRGLLWKLMNNETAQNIARDSLTPEARELLERNLRDRLPALGNGAARVVGRFASGQFFTRWMQSRVRQRGGGRVETGGVAAVNFVMLLWGSCVHASVNHPGDFGVIEIFAAWISGDSRYTINSELYVEIYRLAQALSESGALSAEMDEDYRAFKAIIDELLKFGANGGP